MYYHPRTPTGRRAREALYQHLTPVQRQSLESTGVIWHEGRQAMYQIVLEPCTAWPYVVCGARGMCIGVRDRQMATEDMALALLLFLRADEDAFRATANRMVVWPPLESRNVR